MFSVEINAELVCLFKTNCFPPGMHDYNPMRHNLIEGVSKCMTSRQAAQANLNAYCKTQGLHNEVYTDCFKMNERVGAGEAINCHSRMVVHPASNCLKDCQTTAPSLLLRLQPLVWHWTITDTWVQFFFKIGIRFSGHLNLQCHCKVIVEQPWRYRLKSTYITPDTPFHASVAVGTFMQSNGTIYAILYMTFSLINFSHV